MFVLVFVCLTFDSRNNCQRTHGPAKALSVQFICYTARLHWPVVDAAHVCLAALPVLPHPLPQHPLTHRCRAVLTTAGSVAVPRVLHKANSADECEWVGGDWAVDFQPVLFSIQLTRSHGHLKYTWLNSCCQPDADALARGRRSCRRRNNTTSAQLNPRTALNDRQPGQWRDVGDRLSCVLGIAARLTSRNRSAHLRRIKFNILEPKKLYAYVKSVQLCQVHVHLSLI